MNEPPKPGFWLIVNSVAVIGLCAVPPATFIAAITELVTGQTTDLPLGGVILLCFPALLFLCIPALLFIYLPAATAYWQYRGTFCRDPRCARRLLKVVMLVGTLVWMVTVPGVLLVVLGLVDLNGESLLGAGLLTVPALYITLTYWLNKRRWHAIRTACALPRPRQFSLRDLLAATIWVAIVASITRWIVVRGI